MFIKLIDKDSGKTWYVHTDNVVLVEDVGGEFLVSFADGRPVMKADQCRTVRLTGADAAALLAFIDRNLWKGGGR
jgi:hypothetical protein